MCWLSLVSWALRDPAPAAGPAGPAAGTGAPSVPPQIAELPGQSMAGTTTDKQPTVVLALVDPALEPKVEAQLLRVDP